MRLNPLGMTGRLLGGLAVALAVAACSQGESEEKQLASARAYLEQKDVSAATIQLKALLQSTPNSAPGRELLGRALLDAGDPVGALVELEKARELGSTDEQVVPPMARAMLAVGDHTKVISQFGNTALRDPKAEADLLTSLAIAHALQKDTARAQELSTRALRAQPMFAPAVLVQARLRAADSDFDGALVLVGDVLRNEPDNERAGLLKAELLLGAKQDRDGALEALRKVLAAHPKAVPAHVATIGLLRQSGKVNEAKAQLAALKQAAPAHPDTLLLDAQQRFQDGDFRGTLDITERLLRALPDSPRVLLLAGAAEFRLGSFVKAEGHLTHTLKVAPGFITARRLLAQTHMRAGDPNKALDTLAPVIEGKNADGTSLAIAGEAYLALGDARRADETFKRAAAASPDDPRVRTSVAIGQMVRGQNTEAIGELESIAASDPGTRADLALITARLRANDLVGALKAVEGLQKKMPDRPLPDLLRGRVLLLKKDPAGAASAFEGALKKDPKFFAAVAGLAGIDVAQGRLDAARKRFQDHLANDPASYQAHVALAELARRAGAAADEITGHLSAAVKAGPTQTAPRLLVVEHLLRSGATKDALVAAQDAAVAIPANAQILDALGRAQLANGEHQQAISTFSRLASQQPKNPLAHVRVAEAHAAARDFDKARSSLLRALELQPDLTPARRALASIALSQGQAPEALAIARAMQKSQPKDPAGFQLEGDIQRQQKNWAAAVAAYRTALATGPSPEAAIRLHQAHLAAGQGGEAERFVGDWRRREPNDAAFRFYLGDLAIAKKDWAAAESHYAAVAELQPRNALALNNIAWLMVQQGKQGAVKVAEQANQILPNRAPLMDTLATALAAEGQVPKAIEIQKAAIGRSQDPGLRLNLARLYLKAGEKSSARAELEDLAKLGEKFAGQGEVSELLKSAR